MLDVSSLHRSWSFSVGGQRIPVWKRSFIGFFTMFPLQSFYISAHNNDSSDNDKQVSQSHKLQKYSLIQRNRDISGRNRLYKDSGGRGYII